MDAEKLAFKDNTFDIVVGQGILCHLDISQACQEITRILKSNGKAIFIEPLAHNLIINLYRKLTPELRSSDEHPLRINDIDYISNFYKIDLEYFVLISLLFILFIFFGFNFPKIFEKISKIDKNFLKRIPFFRKYSWIVIIDLYQPKNNFR